MLTKDEINLILAEYSGVDLESLLYQLFDWKAEQRIETPYIDTFIDMIFDNLVK